MTCGLCASPIRRPSWAIRSSSLEAVAAGYAPDKPVLRNLNLRLDADDRIGLLGANGNGKSTLAKLLCGRLDPLSGERRGSKKLTFGYFAQHQLDELNPQASAYDHIAELMPDKTEAQKRARTAAAGFGHDKADTAAAKLSGGEKARLLFTLAAFQSPHLLILDEPTNHLDVDSREALIHGLNEYEGAVILISHDRHLIEATADRLWLVRDGTVTPYDGDLDSYRAEYLSRSPRSKAGQAPASLNGSGGAAQQAGRTPRRRQCARRTRAAEEAHRQPMSAKSRTSRQKLRGLTTRSPKLAYMRMNRRRRCG